MKKFIVFFALLIAPFSLSAFAELPSVKSMEKPRIQGSDSAPITVYEFSSFTCPHCGKFHQDTLDKIRKNYIDTGKVRWITEDFPIDPVAATATLLTRCVPENKRMDIVNAYFAKQSEWLDPYNIPATYQDIDKIAQSFGLTLDDVKACKANKTLIRFIATNVSIATQKYKVNATPTFVIVGEDKPLIGDLPYKDFVTKFDTLLAADKVKTQDKGKASKVDEDKKKAVPSQKKAKTKSSNK